MLLLERVAHGLLLLFFEQPHQLADVLHLPAAAFEVGDALDVGQRVDEFFGQLEPLEQAIAQRQQLFAELLQLVAFLFRSVRLGSPPNRPATRPAAPT